MSVIENRILGSSVFNQGRSQIAGHPDTCDFKAQLVWLCAPERASCGSFPHWKAERDLVRWSVGGAVGPWWRLPLVSSEGCQPGCCNVCGTPEALRTQNPPGCTQEKILCCTSFYLNLFPQIHFSITVIYVFCFFFFFAQFVKWFGLNRPPAMSSTPTLSKSSLGSLIGGGSLSPSPPIRNSTGAFSVDPRCPLSRRRRFCSTSCWWNLSMQSSTRVGGAFLCITVT